MELILFGVCRVAVPQRIRVPYNVSMDNVVPILPVAGMVCMSDASVLPRVIDGIDLEQRVVPVC